MWVGMLLLRVMEGSEIGWWWGSHNLVNLIQNTELDSFKWRIFWYMNYILQRKFIASKVYLGFRILTQVY